MDKIVCREIKPPTSVTHATFARFTGYDRINLCVVKNTTLEIYAVIDQEDGHKMKNHVQGENAVNVADFVEDSLRFRLRHAFKLFGNVQTMNAIRFADIEAKAIGEKYGFDGLFLTFPNSKCSLVAYDPIKDNLRTIALHNLAEDAEGYGSEVTLAYAENNDRSDRDGISLAAVDPLDRCIAVLGSDDQLVIIPFLQGKNLNNLKPSAGGSSSVLESSNLMATSDEAQDPQSIDGGSYLGEGIKTVRSSLVLKPYVVSVGNRNSGTSASRVGSVKSMTFLHGYFEPTLLLLQENELGTWTGSLSDVTNTCNLFALSLNLEDRQTIGIFKSTIQYSGCTKTIWRKFSFFFERNTLR